MLRTEHLEERGEILFHQMFDPQLVDQATFLAYPI